MPTGETPDSDHAPDEGSATSTQLFPPPSPAGPNEMTLVGGAMAATSTPLPSARLPKIPGYTVLCELGRGGMGVVYRANQERLNRTVAVKTLLHHNAADPSDVARFRSEAEAVAAIAHPHVVKVFESGQHDGRSYFAMEYLPGGSLHARLRATAPFAPDEAAALVEKLARAVHAAHSIGIVHRDLKPGNVLFDAAGEPRVTDFGLAKRSSQELTKTQAVMGTPAYMPPEQAAGRAKYVGPPADIYALGVILYECLTGKPPFSGDDSLQLLNQVIADEPPSIRAKRPAVPRDLELICFKCLEKGPNDRYQTAAELADDLRRYANREPVSVRPAGLIEKAVKWARRRPTLATAYGLGVLAAVLLLFGGGAAVLAVDAAEHRRAAEAARDGLARAAEELRDARDGLAEKNREAHAALDRETAARRAADEALAGESRALEAANKLRAEAQLTAYFHNVGFAQREMQEGNFIRAQQLLDDCPEALRGWEWRHVYRAAHQAVEGVTTSFPALDVAVDADGRLLTSHMSGGVTAMHAPTNRTWMVPEKQALAIWQLTRLSADGRRLLRVWHEDHLGGHEKDRVEVADPVSGKVLGRIAVRAGEAHTLAVSDDGGRAFVLFDKSLLAFDLTRWEKVGEYPHPDELYRFGDCLRPTRDGSKVAVPVRSGVRVWEPGGSAGEVVKVPGRWVTATALSDDGKTLVVGGGDGEVYIYAADGRLRKAHLDAHTGPVSRLTVYRDELAASAGEDGVVRVWGLKTGDPLFTMTGLHGPATALRFPTPDTLIATDTSCLLHVYSLAKGATPRRPLWEEERDGFYVANARGDRAFATRPGVAGGEVRAIDGKQRWELPLLAGERFTAAAFAPDGEGLAVGTKSGRVEWRVGPDAPPQTLATLPGPVAVLQFDRRGRRLLAAACGTTAGKVDGTVWVVADLATGEKVREEVGPPGLVALSPDGRWVAHGEWTWKQYVRVYPIDGGQFGSVDVTRQLTALAFTPNSEAIVVNNENAIWVFPRPRSGQRVDGRPPDRVFVGHTAAVTSLGFSPDGKRMVSGAANGRVKVWDWDSGLEAVGLPLGRSAAITRVQFTDDGHNLLAETGNRPPVVFDGRPRPPAIRPNGR